MKTKYAILSTALAIALTLPMFGQPNHDDTTTTRMQKHDMSGMMGKPALDATVEGLHMKVWLMTQEQHKSMMKDHDMRGMKHDGMGMKHDGMGTGKEMKHDAMGTGNGMRHDGMQMDKGTKDAMMSGSHHIMLDVTDAASGKEIANASARILMISPSKKNSSADLKSAMNHFGTGLTLDEKGIYKMTVVVDVKGVSKTREFEYTVK